MERNDYPERDEFSEIPPQEPDSVDFQADFPEPTYHDWQQDYPAEEPAAPEAPFDLSIPDGQESDEPQPEMPEEPPVSPAEATAAGGAGEAASTKTAALGRTAEASRTRW